MRAALLPRVLDNDYRGPTIALWFFGFVLAIKTLQSLMSVFNAHGIAMTADGIPLESYGPAAAQTVVAMFALLGVARLPFYALCWLGLARYRSAISLCFALMVLEYLARSVVLFYLPIERTSAAGGLVVNRVLFALMLVGLVLSMQRRKEAAA